MFIIPNLKGHMKVVEFYSLLRTMTVLMGFLMVPFQALLFGSQYDKGATDTEIKIGNTTSWTGPLAINTTVATTMAYIAKINKEEHGVNKREIIFISKDDGFDPIRTTEATKDLVDRDQVLFMCLSLGTPTNLAVKDFLNGRQVPQLFLQGAADEFYDPEKAPWTLSIYPKYSLEGSTLAKYVLKYKPNAKIGTLSPNSDFGRSFLKGFKATIATMPSVTIVKEQTANDRDPSVEFQIKSLKISEADVFLVVLLGKQAAQALQAAYDTGWKPQLLLFNNATLRDEIFAKVGFEKVKGAVSTEVYKDPSDPRWDNDEAINEYRRFMNDYYPKGNPNSRYNLKGYFAGQLLVSILKKAGDNLTRNNIMNIAKNMNYNSTDFPVLLPVVEIHTTPNDYVMFPKLTLVQFDGNSWYPINE
jgi:branched-chain amino acid transport system substrate-binding protein